jgi:hypothetical protein
LIQSPGELDFFVEGESHPGRLLSVAHGHIADHNFFRPARPSPEFIEVTHTGIHFCSPWSVFFPARGRQKKN